MVAMASKASAAAVSFTPDKVAPKIGSSLTGPLALEELKLRNEARLRRLVLLPTFDEDELELENEVTRLDELVPEQI